MGKVEKNKLLQNILLLNGIIFLFKFLSLNNYLTSAAIVTGSPDTYGDAFNGDNPFIHPVPFTIWLLMQSPSFNRTHGVLFEPNENETREEIGGYYYHRSHECGLHFINQGEGFIIGSNSSVDSENESQRCVWGFVGNQFCTPSVHCTDYQSMNGNSSAECRNNYLQITDAGENFNNHYCTNEKTPLNQEITAPNGILDISYRYTEAQNLDFQCLVKCVPYEEPEEAKNIIEHYMKSSSSNAKEKEKEKEDKHAIPFSQKNSFSKATMSMPMPKPKPLKAVTNLPAKQTTDKCKCGVPNGYKYRIVGGRETIVSQYPWMAGILNEGKKLPFCGGSLINDRYVLTAAHCMEDESIDDLIIVLNEHDFDNDTETHGRSIRSKVAEIIPFHYYLDATFYGDMALIRLETPVDITNYTLTPICLPKDDMELFEGKDVVGAGWGTLMQDGKKSAKLQEVIMRVYSNAACNDYHSSEPKFPPQITDNMLCAGFPEGGRDTCAGDSGGPLIGWDNTKFTQVGVTSWGFGCGNRLNPGVFTRTTSFDYWIESNTLDAVWCSS